MENPKRLQINRTDFYLVSFIGASFALFSAPIIINLNLTLITINPLTIAGLVVFFVIFANIALGLAWLVGTRLPIIFQFAKFGAVGAFNTFLDWGTLNLLMAITSIVDGIGFSLFKGCSFIIATIGAYFWNKYWTFNAKEKSNKDEITKFVLISISGFIINVGLASLLIFSFKDTTIVTPPQLANIAAASATVASLIWNFLGYKLFVFKK